MSLGASSVFAFSVPDMLVDHRLGLSRAVLSGTYSAAGLVGACFSPLLGVAVDRCGSRVCLPLAFLATAVALLLLSAADGPSSTD
jgi:predicted MFS family arabinose efflux permease